MRLYHITQHCAYKIIITRYVRRQLLAGTHAVVIYMSTVRIVKVRVLRVIAIKSVRYRKRRTNAHGLFPFRQRSNLLYSSHISTHTYTYTYKRVIVCVGK